MKITMEWLKEKDACVAGVQWFKAQKKTDAIDVLNALIKDNQLEWANWTIVQVMSRPQYLAYAIFAAEQVIDLFEKKYPEDSRPRKAIQAAKVVLKNDTAENRAAAWEAGEAARAAGAAWAADAAAWAAAWAAAGEAWAAEAAAWAVRAAEAEIDLISIAHEAVDAEHFQRDRFRLRDQK